MTRPSLRALGQFAAAALVALSACSSSSPPNGSDGSGTGGNGDGAGPAVDGSPPPGLFPLHVSSDHASLVTDDGKPFLLHGEAAWSLIAQLNASQVQQYLTDRHNRGVNLVLVNLIEHKFSDRPPLNAAGVAPFSNMGDFTTTNEAYFAFADSVIDLAANLGIAVLLTPSYLGYKDTDQGWYSEMSQMTTAQCTTYGKFLGQRYASRHNIIWVWGGDRTPTQTTDKDAERCMLAIRDAIHAAQPTALTTGHWNEETTSLDEPNFAAAIDIVGVYTYFPTQKKCRTARSSAAKPTYLFETRYENEDDSRGENPNGTPFHVRRQQWSGVLSCGAGEISGNNPIWLLAAGWQNALASPVSIAEQRLASIVQGVAWQTLTLDDAMITSGQGSTDAWTEVIAARTSDQKQALIYIPEGGATSITVDLSHLAVPVTALWQDPTVDHSVAAGDGLTGSHVFETPGLNSGKNHDWVLVLTAQ